jgi:selenide,water dikinase
VVLIGGHSIEDRELKYGLSVTGIVHPNKVLTKKSLRVGDRLILTKPLGTGIINTAIKAKMASPELAEKVTRLMATLNRDAAAVMAGFDVSACTDVTGFGLLGHLAEMVAGSAVSVHLESERLPVLPEALDFASMGLIPGGAYKNMEFRESMLRFSETVSKPFRHLLADPQTSGGLLIGIRKDAAKELVSALRDAGVEDATDIGEIIADPAEEIRIDCPGGAGPAC